MKSSDKSRPDLGTRLGVMLFAVLRFVLRILPETFAFRTAGTLARLVGALSPREQDIALTQLHFAFPRGVPGGDAPTEPKDKQYRKLLGRVFEHYGTSVVEIFTMERYFATLPAPSDSAGNGCPDFERIDSNGQETVMRLINDGRGALALSGHLGAIELLAAYYVKCGVPLSVIGRTPNYPWLADVLEEIRRGYGAQTIWRDDPRSARKILRAFKKGGFVAALVDQDTRLENGFSPFFGLDAAIPVALIRLAVEHQIPIVTSFIYRIAPRHHYIATSEILYDAEHPDTAVQHVLHEFHRRLEELITRYPEQWPWWHRRWRRRPQVDYQNHPEALPSIEQYLAWLTNLTQQKLSNG